MIELKSCPFCGGEAFQYVINDGGSHIRLLVKCSLCDVSFKEYVNSGLQVCELVDSAKKLAEIWNRRAGNG